MGGLSKKGGRTARVGGLSKKGGRTARVQEGWEDCKDGRT